MGLLEEVKKMREEGASEKEISNKLREQGISEEKIKDALNREKIKDAISQEPPKPNNLKDGLSPSILEENYLPNEKKDIPEFHEKKEGGFYNPKIREVEELPEKEKPQNNLKIQIPPKQKEKQKTPEPDTYYNQIGRASCRERV